MFSVWCLVYGLWVCEGIWCEVAVVVSVSWWCFVYSFA